MLQERFDGMKIVVQPSDYRCFTDAEYEQEGVALQEDVRECDLLLGVKEVDIPTLIPGKSYLFFSHTAKEQPHNRKLLQAVIGHNITLLDYEYLTRKDKSRVVAFGRWAGIVGTYNGLRAYGLRNGKFELQPAWKLSGLEEMKSSVADLAMGNVRVVLTGGGRVAGGAVEILEAAGFNEIVPESFMNVEGVGKIFTRLDPWHYAKHRQGKPFNFKHFVEYPGEYENAFVPYASVSDMFIACHFWDPFSPEMLTREDLKSVPLKIIADISCDIDGPIASTIRPSTIAEPLYGYDPATGTEAESPFSEKVITVMAVDNLPGELPRDASTDFGNALIENVFPALLEGDTDGIIQRATIAKDGKLTELFSYLEDYVNGN